MLNIVFEDESLLLVNKSAGVVVNRSETVNEKTLQDEIDEYLPALGSSTSESGQTSDFMKRSGIVHRLDRETSGLLIIAKNERAFLNLQSQFKKREVEKEYLALCHGKLETKGVILGKVGRIRGAFGKFGLSTYGREAETRYKVLSYFKMDNNQVEKLVSSLTAKDLDYYKQFSFFSYLRLFPKTGRTHQIRVHLKSLQRPIVSDKLYLNKRLYLFDIKWCPRLFLHAERIKFKHPLTGSKLDFKSDLPDDLLKALSRLDEVT